MQDMNINEQRNAGCPNPNVDLNHAAIQKPNGTVRPAAVKKEGDKENQGPSLSNPVPMDTENSRAVISRQIARPVARNVTALAQAMRPNSKPSVMSKKQPHEDPEASVVRDIDAGDWDRPLYCPIYVGDVMVQCFSEEGDYTVPRDYLNGRIIYPKHRAVLIDRLIQVHDKFQCSQETIYLTVNYVDRYLRANPEIGKSSLHLVGITALFISCKVEEISVPSLDDFVYVTDNECKRPQILAMESSMLKSLQFKLLVPHSLVFLRRFSKAASVSMIVHIMAKYLIELTFLDVAFCEVKSSKIAAAALWLARKILTPQSCQWDATIEHHCTYPLISLHETIIKIVGLLEVAHIDTYREVYKKYSKQQLHKVANSPELKVFLRNSASHLGFTFNR